MSLLDDDLTEKLDIPMIFAAIESLRETMNKNLEEIAVHEKAISALHKNVSNARFELENVKNLLDEIVNPKPKYNDAGTGLQNSELQKLIEDLTSGFTYTDFTSNLNNLWWCPSKSANYSTTAAITANGARYYTTTCDAYDDTKTIAGVQKVDAYIR